VVIRVVGFGRSNVAIRVEGDVAYVPLTQGRTAIIDADDVPLIDAWAWHVVAGPKRRCYAQRSGQVAGKKYSVAMHRVIAGAMPGEDVDHVDGDGLNNRRANLRRCSTSQNMANIGARSDNALGVKGVYASRTPGKYTATIQHHGQSRHLGTFTSIADAKAAYDAAAQVAFGEFARSS